MTQVDFWTDSVHQFNNNASMAKGKLSLQDAVKGRKENRRKSLKNKDNQASIGL